MVKRLVIELNNNINKGKSSAIVDKNIVSCRILYILQRNRFIDSFKSINTNKLLVNFRFLELKFNVINQMHLFQRQGSVAKKTKKLIDKKTIAHFSFKNFVIISTRYGLMSNRKAALLNIEGIPLLGIE